jgi:hypothetical protein
LPILKEGFQRHLFACRRDLLRPTFCLDFANLLPPFVRQPETPTLTIYVRLDGRKYMTISRSLAGTVTGGLIAASAAGLLSGCSSDAAFPAVHDMPAARAEPLLTADEIKQSTNDLLSDRDRLAAMAGNVER